MGTTIMALELQLYFTQLNYESTDGNFKMDTTTILLNINIKKIEKFGIFVVFV